MKEILIYCACFFILLLIIFALKQLLKKDIIKMKTDFSLKGYHLIYSDTRPKDKNENIEYGTMLYDKRLDIQGKPDFIFESRFLKRLVPVEIKSGYIKDEAFPHEGDVMQLCAYFAIIESEYGKKPRYGRLLYKDYMFEIRNTKKLRKELIKTTSQMRKMLKGKDVFNEGSYVKCRYCICRGTVCEFIEK